MTELAIISIATNTKIIDARVFKTITIDITIHAIITILPRNNDQHHINIIQLGISSIYSIEVKVRNIFDCSIFIDTSILINKERRST